MKKIKHILVVTGILFGGMVRAERLHAAVTMPSEIQGIRLDMTIEDFLKARPQLERKLSRAPDWEKRKGHGAITELFDSGDFNQAVYLFKDGVMAGLLLYVPKNNQQSSGAVRKNLYKKYVQRWGAPTRSEVGTLNPDSSKPEKNMAAIVWENSDLDARLFSSENSYRNGPIAILRLSSPKSRKKLPEGFKARSASSVEKAQILKSMGVDEN